MAKDEEVRLIIKAATEQAVSNIGKLNNSMANVEKSSSKLKTGVETLKKSWLSMTVAVAGAGAAINKATKDASNLQETQSKFNVVFGASKKSLDVANKGITELTKKYAMSNREAMELTSGMGDLLKPLGFIPEKAAQTSFEITRLAADLGSFKNIRSEEAFNAIRSAVVGETEPMRRLGVVLNDTILKQEALNLGFKVGKGVLDPYAKAQAALSIIFKSTKDAQGDMIRTSESYANTQKRAQAAAEDMSASLGTVLLPVMTSIQRAIAAGARAVASLGKTWQTIIVVSGLAAVAIGILTKVVMAFGVSLSAAIWPVTAIAAAIAAVIVIVRKWDVVLGGIEKAWNAVKYAFEIFWQSMKVGYAWITLQSFKVAEAIASPLIKAINKVIQGFNKLPGVNISVLDNIFEAQSAQSEKLLRLELDRLEKIHIADVEDKARKEETEATHNEKMNEIATAKVEADAAREEAKLASDMVRKDKEKKGKLKKEEDYKKASKKIDVDITKNKLEQRGLDTSSYGQWSSFMMNTLDKDSKTQFKIWKAFSIQQALISTHQAAISGYNAMVGIPVVGQALGVAAATAAIAFGMLQVNKIRSTQFQGAEEGALIRGVPGSAGTLIRAGENNKDEAIIPLENTDVMNRLGGGTTVNMNIDTAIMDEDYPQSVAIKIDNALYKLKESGLSKSL